MTTFLIIIPSLIMIFFIGFMVGATRERLLNEKSSFQEQDMINFAFDTYLHISNIMKVPFNQISENKNHVVDNFENFKKQ